MPNAATLAARELSNRKSTLGGPVDAMPAPVRVAVPVVEAAEKAQLTEPVTEQVYEPAAYTTPERVTPVKKLPVKAKVPTQIRAGMVPQIAAKPVSKVAALQPATKPSAKQKVVKRSVARSETVAPTFWVYGVAEDDVLNVRMGPSAETDVVGAIAPAARGVRMAGACEGMWCLVEFGDQKGWVNRSYLVYEVPGLVAAR